MQGLDYDALALSSGEKAIEYLKEEFVDLVILDMIMDPGISGLETAKQLFALCPDIKIILASGYSEDGTAQEALKHGVKTFIQKPYAVNTLGKIVREILDSK